MTDTPATVHVQTKDPLPRELQFLQPLDASTDQARRVMVGPRQYLNVQDATDQTVAASGVVFVSYGANNIAAGSWSKPPANAGVIFEHLRANISGQDASGKLAITIPLVLGTGPIVNAPISAYALPLPFTFPASNVRYEIRALTPMPAYQPTDGDFSIGPTATFTIINTDGAAAHTYRRALVAIYRYFFDFDYTKERVYVLGTLR